MPHCAPTYSNALPYPTPRNDTMLYIHITSNQYTKKITQNWTYQNWSHFSQNRIILFLQPIKKKLKNEMTEKVTATSGYESDIDTEEWTKASRRDQVAFDATFAATNRVPTRAATEQKLTGFLFLLLLLLNLNLLLRLHRSHFQRSNFFWA